MKFITTYSILQFLCCYDTAVSSLVSCLSVRSLHTSLNLYSVNLSTTKKL